jgi:hypothetical protein
LARIGARMPTAMPVRMGPQRDAKKRPIADMRCSLSRGWPHRAGAGHSNRSSSGRSRLRRSGGGASGRDAVQRRVKAAPRAGWRMHDVHPVRSRSRAAVQNDHGLTSFLPNWPARGRDCGDRRYRAAGSPKTAKV